MAQESALAAFALGDSNAAEFVGTAWRILGQIAGASDDPIFYDGQTWDAAACFARSVAVFMAADMPSEAARTQVLWRSVAVSRGVLAKEEALRPAARLTATVSRMPPDRDG